MIAPKVFGREMIKLPVFAEESGLCLWEIAIGNFRFDVTRFCDGKVRGTLHRPCAPPIVVGICDESEAIRELESTASRIMRECFEIAGEMVAVKQEYKCVIGCNDLVARSSHEVRFKNG